jgi:hypothetical protein
MIFSLGKNFTYLECTKSIHYAKTIESHIGGLGSQKIRGRVYWYYYSLPFDLVVARQIRNVRFAWKTILADIKF